ncbi:MAG: hypothetical protein ACLQVL_30140 [Terriglobia bacterium]
MFRLRRDEVAFGRGGQWLAMAASKSWRKFSSRVAVGTSLRVVEGIRDYCRRKRLHLADVIGSLKLPGE